MKVETTPVVLASGNVGKLREIGQALLEFGIELKPQHEFGVGAAIEDGQTFVDNALKKARHAAAATGLPALADDSGLAVDALDGRPGVHSARFAGADASDEDNVALLLDQLQGIEDRAAQFVCVLALVRDEHDANPIIAHGQWVGHIATERVGAQGFGYDPVFVDPELQITAAQMSREQKLQRSHRGSALTRLRKQLTHITL